jgi:hypothetical protein
VKALLPDGMDIFKPNIPFWVNLGGPVEWNMLLYFMAYWYSLGQVGIFYCTLVHLVFILYIFPFLVFCAEKNLATLGGRTKSRRALNEK